MGAWPHHVLFSIYITNPLFLELLLLWVNSMFTLQYKILKCLVLNVNSGTTTYICDFHREQAWERWLKKGDNGLTHKKDDVLKLLRTVAKSNTEDGYHKNLSPIYCRNFV
jgi:hypothetical protein